MIDLLLPAAPKDYVKIPHVIAAVAEFVSDVGRVCLVTPDVQGNITSSGLRVDFYTDAEVLPSGYNRSVVGWRPNWTSQQFIKLLQNVTETEYWLTIDADTFFNRKVSFFTETGKPILYTGASQYHSPYFGFNMKLLGYAKIHSGSFLSECTLYKRSFVDELITEVGGRDEFIRKAVEIINTSQGHPADAEIYGTWVMKHHKDHYELKPIISSLGGRYGQAEYTEQEVIDARQRFRKDSCQTFSLHSWNEYWN